MKKQRACYVMAISEMGRLEVSSSTIQPKIADLLSLSESVLSEYSDTLIPSFINGYLQSLSGSVLVDVSQFCRILTMLRCLDKAHGEPNEDTLHVLEQVAKEHGKISFEQYCRVHIVLEDVASPLSLCLFEMTQQLFSEQTLRLQQLFDRYQQKKTHLTRLVLRSRIDPEFDFEMYKWSRIDQVHEARGAYRQHKIHHDHWRLHLALLTLLDKHIPVPLKKTEDSPFSGLLEGLFGKKVPSKVPVEDSQWIQVRALLDQFIESRCTNQQIIKQLAGIVL